VSRILHAGLHKTGSTFLQKEFFPKLKNTVFVEKHLLWTAPIYRPERMSVVFSSEAACGRPYPETQPFNTARIESNIALLEVDKVLVFQREFNSWVLSLYFQTLNQKYAWSLNEFIEHNRTNLLSWQDAPNQIEKACARIGIECMVIQYEDFVSDQMATLHRLSSFIDGSSFDADEIHLQKRSNRSRHGILTISAYRLLNTVFNSRLGGLSDKFFKSIPRSVISSRLGSGLERVSSRRLSVDDVRQAFK